MTDGNPVDLQDKVGELVGEPLGTVAPGGCGRRKKRRVVEARALDIDQRHEDGTSRRKRAGTGRGRPVGSGISI
jgi:hypothetical protein